LGRKLMVSFALKRLHRNRISGFARIALVAVLVAAGSISVYREALAGCAAASAVAEAGLNACSSNSGKALYGCVANVLDQLSSSISRDKVEPADSALHEAASKLRAAVNKVQALSAIAQCRAVVVATISKVRAMGRPGTGLETVAAVLAHAARLIQLKG
jgi:hypothetical protein